MSQDYQVPPVSRVDQVLLDQGGYLDTMGLQGYPGFKDNKVYQVIKFCLENLTKEFTTLLLVIFPGPEGKTGAPGTPGPVGRPGRDISQDELIELVEQILEGLNFFFCFLIFFS